MIKFKGNAICLTACGLLLAGALLGGCSLPASENTEHAADTAQGTAAQTDAELIKTVSSEKTFYNQIGKSLDDLPVTELSDVLSTIGADDEAADGYFMTDLLERFYYSVDLSKLEPICYTPEQELVCKLSIEAETPMLIVLDSADAPANVRYYLAEGWMISTEQVTFLLDGQAPQGDDANLCAQLFQTHATAGGLKKVMMLDGNPAMHTVTVRFAQYPGLEYHFQYYQYQDYDGYVLYSLLDGCMEQVVLE